MSFFTTLPTERYSPDAFSGFQGGREFSLGNAKALAWMSQLSYETADHQKISDILTGRGLRLVANGECDGVLVRESRSVLPMSSTHCFVATGRAGTVIAFAGTDPVVLANWRSDFNIHFGPDGAAQGYADAADVVWPDIRALLNDAVPTPRKIFVAGHSLGGAIAAVVAKRLNTERIADVEAVYTYGMPRTGNAAFADAYNAVLGQRTYRLVHGDDLVPTVGPSNLQFRHVGRFLRCARLGRFDPANLTADTTSDAPPFEEEAWRDLRRMLHHPLQAVTELASRFRLAADLMTGAGPPGMRTDPGGIAIELLPPRLRDHMPDRYIAACS